MIPKVCIVVQNLEKIQIGMNLKRFIFSNTKIY